MYQLCFILQFYELNFFSNFLVYFFKKNDIFKNYCIFVKDNMIFEFGLVLSKGKDDNCKLLRIYIYIQN